MSDSSLMNEDVNGITMRPATVDDDEFLFKLYASTRSDELAAVGWNDQQRDTFLRMQYNLQRGSHQETGGHIILSRGREIGRLIVKQTEEAMLLVDIVILPPFRNRGIGTSVMESLLEDATVAGKPVRLHVLASSFARRLYERLGFVIVDGDFANIVGAEAYVRMIWTPTRAP